jgi:hypothetical protein
MGSIWNMLASLGLPSWQHMNVRGLYENSIAAEVTVSRKAILIPRIQLCSLGPTISFKLS